MLIVLQLEGFGSAGLLTAAEEKKLGRQLQALIVLEARREEATARLGRQISSSEWMAECSMTDAKVFKRTIKVGILLACTPKECQSRRCLIVAANLS